MMQYEIENSKREKHSLNICIYLFLLRNVVRLHKLNITASKWLRYAQFIHLVLQ